MTGLPLFSGKKMTGPRLFCGLKISDFPLCRTINFAPSLIEEDASSLIEEDDEDVCNFDVDMIGCDGLDGDVAVCAFDDVGVAASMTHGTLSIGYTCTPEVSSRISCWSICPWQSLGTHQHPRTFSFSWCTSLSNFLLFLIYTEKRSTTCSRLLVAVIR